VRALPSLQAHALRDPAGGGDGPEPPTGPQGPLLYGGPAAASLAAAGPV